MSERAPQGFNQIVTELVDVRNYRKMIDLFDTTKLVDRLNDQYW
jgi:hypothetical protein